MHVLGIAGSKGGTGKTTLGTNLAVAFAPWFSKLLIVDCDNQQSSSKWRQARQRDSVRVDVARLSDAVREIERARRAEYDLAIIDFPGRDDVAVTAALKACHLIVVPSAPFAIELKELVVTRRAAVAAGRPCVTLLVRTTHPSSPRNRHYIEKYPDHFAPMVLRNYVAYADSYARGEGVVETFPNSVAADEVRKVCDFLLARLRDANHEA